MILYALACDDGHRFESWFRDSAAFDEHKSGQLLSCPVCASTAVTKTIMAPAVVSPQLREATSEVDVAPANDAERCDTRNAVRRLRARLLSTGDDVGQRFATEARRIHEGDAPDRQIYGQASIAEARDLLEDGILVLPIPTDPDAMN